jgi:hypothetical protein
MPSIDESTEVSIGLLESNTAQSSPEGTIMPFLSW